MLTRLFNKHLYDALSWVENREGIKIKTFKIKGRKSLAMPGLGIIYFSKKCARNPYIIGLQAKLHKIPKILTLNKKQQDVLTLFHEVAHIKQYQIYGFCVTRPNIDYEEALVDYNYDSDFWSSEEYRLSPLERDADLQAYKWICEYYKI